jgi:hypothetical protein
MNIQLNQQHPADGADFMTKGGVHLVYRDQQKIIKDNRSF